MIGVLRVAQPMIGDAHAASERDLTVDDENLAMRTVVHFFERVPAWRIEVIELGTGTAQPLFMRGTDGDCANRVRNDRDLHAAARRALECGRKLIGNTAVTVDVGLETDPARGRLDRGEHWRKDLIAIGQHFVTVAARQVGAHEGGEIRRVPTILDTMKTFDVERFLILRKQQGGGDDRARSQENDERTPYCSTDHESELCNLQAASFVSRKWQPSCLRNALFPNIIELGEVNQCVWFLCG